MLKRATDFLFQLFNSSFRRFPELGCPIQQCVLPLVAKVDDEVYPIGTGFVLNASGLIATAAHVLEEAEGYAVRRRREDGEGYYDHYELYAVYLNNSPVGGLTSVWGGLLPINNVWAPEGLDIGFAWVTLPRHVASGEVPSLRPVRLRPAIPPTKSNVTALGYHGMIGSFQRTDPPTVKLELKTAISSGSVLEVHPEYRDRGLLSFPCFRTNARFDGAMSGGPIFDSSGNVCGVVCSGTKHEGKGHTSYGSLIWPIFGCEIDIAPKEGAPVQKTLLWDLALNGSISVDDSLDTVRVEQKSDGTRDISIKLG
jgi:hypothetical protein